MPLILGIFAAVAVFLLVYMILNHPGAIFRGFVVLVGLGFGFVGVAYILDTGITTGEGLWQGVLALGLGLLLMFAGLRRKRRVS